MKRPKIERRHLVIYLSIFIIIPTVTLLLGRYIDRVLGLPRFPSFPLNMFLGVYTMILFVNIGVKSTRELYEKGSGLPWGEAKRDVRSSNLVTSGLFSYTRNPMILGYSFLPFSMGLIFQSLGMALSVTPIVLLLNFVILRIREEPGLFYRFDEDYLEYRRSTPILIPRLKKIIDL